MQAQSLSEAPAARDVSSEEAGPAPDTEEDVGPGPGQQEDYTGNGLGVEEGGMALSGRDPRLTLLWEWQCPLPPSLTLSTRVTCMAWNKASLACLHAAMQCRADMGHVARQVVAHTHAGQLRQLLS